MEASKSRPLIFLSGRPSREDSLLEGIILRHAVIPIRLAWGRDGCTAIIVMLCPLATRMPDWEQQPRNRRLQRTTPRKQQTNKTTTTNTNQKTGLSQP